MRTVSRPLGQHKMHQCLNYRDPEENKKIGSEKTFEGYRWKLPRWESKKLTQVQEVPSHTEPKEKQPKKHHESNWQKIKLRGEKKILKASGKSNK